MKEFLEFVVKHLVDHPENIIVEFEEKDNNYIFKLKVAEGDIGKIIGRHGQTATSLRVLLKAVAAKEGKRAGTGYHRVMNHRLSPYISV